MFCLLSHQEEFDVLRIEQKNFIIYKFNSRGCSISEKTLQNLQKAKNEMNLEHIYYVDVIMNKSLSNYITEHAQIRHESPQIIVYREGQMLAHASHMKIGRDWLEKHINK